MCWLAEIYFSIHAKSLRYRHYHKLSIFSKLSIKYCYYHKSVLLLLGVYKCKASLIFFFTSVIGRHFMNPTLEWKLLFFNAECHSLPLCWCQLPECVGPYEDPQSLSLWSCSRHQGQDSHCTEESPLCSVTCRTEVFTGWSGGGARETHLVRLCSTVVPFHTSLTLILVILHWRHTVSLVDS